MFTESTLGGGNHGYLALVMSAADYALQTGTIPFAELGRHESGMRAAYYFRFAYDDCSDEPPRDVASIVPPRPSKPVGCTLAQLGQCKPVI
jgi:hypothetical protein